MRSKTSNKFNILLITIALLLVFVSLGVSMGKTNSWLKGADKVGFIIQVDNINIVVKQDEREIISGGKIYLGTDIIEADTTYDLNVSITNNEEGSGFYMRAQAFAVVNGTTYNINNLITSDMYNYTDGWMYTSSSTTSLVKTQMSSGDVIMLIDTVTFPSSFINQHEGEFIRLYLYIEGSPTGEF